MNPYILLRDLPNLKAGAKFIYNEATDLYEYRDETGEVTQAYSLQTMKDSASWFALKEARFRPQYGEKYFYVNTMNGVFKSGESVWNNGQFDVARYEQFNCFESKEDTEEIIILLGNAINDYHVKKNAENIINIPKDKKFISGYESPKIGYETPVTTTLSD